MLPFEVGAAAELVQKILYGVQFVIISCFVVCIVTQVPQIFHSGTTRLIREQEREENDTIN